MLLFAENGSKEKSFSQTAYSIFYIQVTSIFSRPLAREVTR